LLSCVDLDSQVRRGAEIPTDYARVYEAGEIEFDVGKTSSTVSTGSLVGEITRHVFDANALQQATVSITSLENNASFMLVTPEGEIISFGTDDQASPAEFSDDSEIPASVVLPDTGTYECGNSNRQ